MRHPSFCRGRVASLAVGLSALLIGSPAYSFQTLPSHWQDSFAMSSVSGDGVLPGALDPIRSEGHLADSRFNAKLNSELSKEPLVGNDELSRARGGFLTANGIEFDFGANVQTLVNGQLALQTTVQWSPSGVTVQQTPGMGPNIVAIPSAQLTALFGSGGGQITNGVQVIGPSGSTETAANVAAGQVQNLVANSANNQAITQNTAVTLAIYNFAAWQQQLTQHALTNQLAMQALAVGVGR